MAASNGTPATTETSFTSAWERAQKLTAEAEAGGQVPAALRDQEHPADAPEEPEPEEKPEPKPAAKKPEAKADEKKADDEKKENEGAVAPQERAKWREQKRKEREKLDNDRRQFTKELTEAKSKYGKYEEAEALFAAGDVVGATEKLSGKKWNDLQKEAINRVKGMDPRVDKLERELQAEREARAKAEAERAEREQQEANTREQTKWIAGLKESLSDGDDEIALLAQSSLGFIDHVFEFQREEFDPDTGETLQHREAAEKALPHWRSMYEELHKIFGERGASNPDASKGAAHRKGSTSAKPGGKPPTTLSQRKAAEASPPEPRELVDDAAWKKRWSKNLRESRET